MSDTLPTVRDPNLEKEIAAQRERRIKTEVAVQSVLLGVPYIGASLERFIFGATNERRLDRVEKTLAELAEALNRRNATESFKTEEFVNLFEAVMPSIGKATAEEKRGAFRSLLINAALTSAGSSEWEEARLASELIDEIEAPGLELLAKLHALRKEKTDIAVVFDEPACLAHWPDDAPSAKERFPLTFGFTVTEEWVLRLQRLKILSFTRPLRRPSDSTKEKDIFPGFGSLMFTKLGELLVKWSLTEKE